MTETRACPVCDAENHAQNLYCESCGSTLPAASSDEPVELTDFTLEPVEENPADLYGQEDAPAPDTPEFEGVTLEPVEEGFEDDFSQPADDDPPTYELEAIVEEIPAQDSEFAEFAQADEISPEPEAYELDEPAQDWDKAESLDSESVEDFLQAQQEEAAAEAPEEPLITPQRTTSRPQVTVEPLPTPGGFEIAPTLTLFQKKEAKEIFYLEESEFILGGAAANPQTNGSEGIDGEGDEDAPEQDHSSPRHIDLSSLTGEELPQKFVAIYKQNKNLTLYALSDLPTQLNDELLSLGDKRDLKNGDLIILGESLALRLEADPT